MVLPPVTQARRLAPSEVVTPRERSSTSSAAVAAATGSGAAVGSAAGATAGSKTVATSG